MMQHPPLFVLCLCGNYFWCFSAIISPDCCLRAPLLGSATISGGTITLKSCGGSGGGVGCFADGQTAVLESGKHVPIESLRVGDKVLASTVTPAAPMPQFSPVTWIMAHKTPKQTLSITLKAAANSVQGEGTLYIVCVYCNTSAVCRGHCPPSGTDEASHELFNSRLIFLIEVFTSRRFCFAEGKDMCSFVCFFLKRIHSRSISFSPTTL